MSEPKRCIYIMTNPSFPQFVKIGYATDVRSRLNELNRSTAVPYSFRVYATYEVDTDLSDTRVHKIIDKLNPDLRAREMYNGRPRVREFFAMTKEDAFSILQAIAEIHGEGDRVKMWPMTPEEAVEDEDAQEVMGSHSERLAPFTFDKCGIKPGEVVSFACNGNENDGVDFMVLDDKNVEFQGEPWSLSGLASRLLGRPNVAGPRYFKHRGRRLSDIRDEREGRTARAVRDTWIIPCNPNQYDVEGAFRELDAVEWKQSTNIQRGDIVYIYVSRPWQEIAYRCVAEATDLHGARSASTLKFYKDESSAETGIKRYMVLRLEESFERGKYPLDVLKKHGLNGNVQGPRMVRDELEAFLDEKPM